MNEDVTFVVIGRNEAKNLPRCFESIQMVCKNIIFIDSGSVDNSLEIAKNYEIKKIIKYKANFPTPALSRCIGTEDITTEYIQFLDGDMSIDDSWINVGLSKLKKHPEIALVHGNKKHYINSESKYNIQTDNKDWQSPYLGGAFLIRSSVYHESGGFDPRFYGEEERDLYIRIRTLGYQVWYLNTIMASHYDFKNKPTNLKFLVFSDGSAIIWLPLVKSFKENRLLNYCYVYRRILPSLFFDLFSITSLFFGLQGLIFAILFQILELAYIFSIKRRGYFIIWKVGIISFWKFIWIYNRKIKFKAEIV